MSVRQQARTLAGFNLEFLPSPYMDKAYTVKLSNQKPCEQSLCYALKSVATTQQIENNFNHSNDLSQEPRSA